MRKILVLLLIILPLKLYAVEIEVIADVNGVPISNLDIEKRISSIHSLFGAQNIDQKELGAQILRQLIDEMIITTEAHRLNIKLSNEELNNAVTLFLVHNFKVKEDEVDQYITKNNIDLAILREQMKCQLLWVKVIETRIVPFINVSDKEVDDIKGQVEKSDYLVQFQEFTIPHQEDKDDYYVGVNFAKKLRNNDNWEPSIEMRQTTVNLSQIKDELKNILEKLEAGNVTDPIKSNEGYSVIKMVDKVKLDHALLESTLKLKQAIIESLEDPSGRYKEQKVNCLNFDEFAKSFKSPNLKEFEIKMRDLNPDLQLLFSKANIDEMVELRSDGALRLMMICDIKNDISNLEAIKQQIYQQKIMSQSNLLLDDMRKNAAVSVYRHTFKGMNYKE
ncbi:MAG: Chaperone SurA [Wolbachia endosymbiont of Ctenocephalides orientis wCori]|nr:MAG: Chaperone SurA [Wolbachia endosymbiont of Ctenocephalides orientis wCori]